MRRWLVRALAGAVGFGLAGPAAALVTVSLEPTATTVTVGSTLDVSIRADLSDPIVGFGFDLVFDEDLLSTAGPPVIGSAWTGVSAADGDGLAGAAFPEGLTGSDLLLATVTLHADAVGVSVLSLATSEGDATEGFAFDPSFATGFDTLAPVTPLMITIVPEPATGALLGLALVALGLGARGAGWRRSPTR